MEDVLPRVPCVVTESWEPTVVGDRWRGVQGPKQEHVYCPGLPYVGHLPCHSQPRQPLRSSTLLSTVHQHPSNPDHSYAQKCPGSSNLFLTGQDPSLEGFALIRVLVDCRGLVSAPFHHQGRGCQPGRPQERQTLPLGWLFLASSPLLGT